MCSNSAADSGEVVATDSSGPVLERKPFCVLQTIRQPKTQKVKGSLRFPQVLLKLYRLRHGLGRLHSAPREILDELST